LEQRYGGASLIGASRLTGGIVFMLRIEKMNAGSDANAFLKAR
jgi:hypothetical protein